MTSLRVCGIGDLLAFLPYHLGFHPTDSFVIIFLAQGRLGVVQRLDRPACGAHSDTEEVELVVRAARRQPPEDVLLVAYGCDDDVSLPALNLRIDLLGHGLPVSDVLLVDGGRWRSLLCSDPSCAPPGGQVVPEPSSVPAVCEYVGRGASPSPDRTGLVELLRPVQHAHVRAAFDEARLQRETSTGAAVQRWRRNSLRAWSQVVAQKADPRTRGAALAGLLDVQCRDAVLAVLAPAIVPEEVLTQECRADVARHGPVRAPEGHEESLRRRAVLICLARESPPAARAPSCTVLAVFAWSLGDGAMARVALAQAFGSEPSYPLADLVRRLILLQVRPEDLQAS